MKSRLLPTLVLTALLLTLPASAAGMVFPDVSAEYWAYSDIQKATDHGLMNGLPDGNFGPETRLDRAAFVTILSRMFSWDTASLPAAPSFTDVVPGQWYYGAVEAARANGVTDGGGAFRPTAYISREEMSVMLVRALGYETLAQDLAPKGSVFPDVKDHAGHIALAYAIGMTTGIRNERTGALEFQPDTFATRGQAAAMLVRVYERYTSKIDFLNGFYAFSSYAQIDLTPKMDAVSVGWARLSWNEGGAWINSTSAEGNDWVKPADVTPATGYFEANGTEYNLNVYADTKKTVPLPDGSKTSVVDKATATAEGRAQAVAAIAAAVPEYAGVTIDFEGLKGDAVKADFVTFLTQLRAALPAGKTLYVCVQPDTWYTGFDYRGIGAVADKVILMAHDYQWTSVDDSYLGAVMGGPRTKSPVTPLPEIYQALADITDPVIGVEDRSKIALQISFGTAGFKVDSENKLLDTTIYHPAQDTISKRLKQPGTVVTYDEHDRNPLAAYTNEEGERFLLWYEDARSVKDKLDLARMFGVTGVSIWRLGIIPTDAAGGIHYDVWSAIEAQR